MNIAETSADEQSVDGMSAISNRSKIVKIKRKKTDRSKLVISKDQFKFAENPYDRIKTVDSNQP